MVPARGDFDSHFLVAAPPANYPHAEVGSGRVHQLWRTLFLSCFKGNVTLFPYIKYVKRLDTRTMMNVLCEINTCPSDGYDVGSMERSSYDIEAADYFFAAPLTDFEISGVVRGQRVLIGDSAYIGKSRAGGKEVKLFVGDTALMMFDCKSKSSPFSSPF